MGSAGWPGLKPSLRFHSTGSIGTSLSLRGIHWGLNATRRPVAVEASATVNRSLGNGSMHARATVASQPAPTASSLPATVATMRGSVLVPAAKPSAQGPSAPVMARSSTRRIDRRSSRS